MKTQTLYRYYLKWYSVPMDSHLIDQLANLARLTVPAQERASLSKDIEHILSFIDTVKTVELGGMAEVTEDAVNVFREDEVHPLQSDHDLIEAAPLHQDHYVKVPKVLE
jgi:aspartyl-tRNA(Asn)/glutamyl-tRNA(Gln) amidotransferase subunit C